MEPMAVRSQFGLPEDQAVLLFFGFVRPYKGLDVLLDALPIVRRRMPIHLFVVGEMWDRTTPYLSHIQRLGIEACVTLVNRYVPNEELESYFSAADVVVLPYRSATQSAVIQLAFGFDKPVITTDVGGLAEAVTDGVNGLIVPPADPNALAEAIIRFFGDDLQTTLAQGVLAHKQRFSWDRVMDTIDDLVGR
jgi:glycosyltransferase involved in cell wall biosynthesis